MVLHNFCLVENIKIHVEKQFVIRAVNDEQHI